jgi:hypothetical protein
MSFSIDAKIRNGDRLMQAARLLLEAALEGNPLVTGYEGWTRQVTVDIEEMENLEPPPRLLDFMTSSDEDGDWADPEEEAAHGDAVDLLLGLAVIRWGECARIQKKLAILLEDGRSEGRAELVDKAWELVGMATRLYRLASSRETAWGRGEDIAVS